MRYRIVPKELIDQQVILKSSRGECTVPVPKFWPTEWEGLMRIAAVPDVLTVQQSGQFEFTAIYDEDARVVRVQFVTVDRGEEHRVRLYPGWMNQKTQIARAFTRCYKQQ
jgi:hypothetical protein